MVYLTVYPNQGLGSDVITNQDIQNLANQCKEYNDAGRPVFVRFGPEMNGNWFAYSQQPSAFQSVWKQVYNAINQVTNNTALIWSPNMGYTPVSAVQGSPDFVLLDTNHDGVLDQNDDFYLPYYPGDEYVDWVGLSIYHFSYSAPYYDNTVPKSNEFESVLTHFYTSFAVQRGKPIVVEFSYFSVSIFFTVL